MTLAVPPEADDAQRRSSDPAHSVFVSANAGAGKTFVLAQRVVRLLLSGVPAPAILCLTFTNAAAAEMATRVYRELAGLTAMGEAELSRTVEKLAPGVDRSQAMGRARTLFAEALEAPGGLKVQTIHAFAASLLYRFPLEANVPSGFTLLDDATRDELLDRAIAATLAEAAQPQTYAADALRALVNHVSDAEVASAIKSAVGERDGMAWLIRRWPDSDDIGELLRRTLAIPEPSKPVISDARCREIIAAVSAHAPTAKKSKAFAEGLAAALDCPDEDGRLSQWMNVFFTEAGTPRVKPVTTGVLAALPGLEHELDAEVARLCVERDRLAGERAIDATLALAALAVPTAERFEAEKRRRSLIDYDEEIALACDLLKGAAATMWVRHKLDEGIDHIMVDEAQDTSPGQWAIIDSLASEFFAGAGARDVPRTLFVVGDEKQSIYSFQGADPRLFDRKRHDYGAKAGAAAAQFETVSLAHSFRSSAQVLSAVDRIFASDALASSVGALPGTVQHVAIRQVPGGVDVWPLTRSGESQLPDAWDAPLDLAAAEAGPVRLAKAIGEHIAKLLVEGPDGSPPLQPGEIMILARKREPFVHLMNAELKARGIPAGGADRLVITEHIAVKDMLALARALISPDDLSLAAVLKSPLFGFDEDALFRVAHGRSGSLLAALAAGDDAARAAAARLVALRTLALSARPFELFARILIGEGRRADFAARMGAEAEDALDAFLDMVLDFEKKGVTALDPFLSRIERSAEELRRSPDAAGNAVRVMTCHGAKGLEAKLVFLADVGSSAGGPNRQPTVVPIPDADGLVHVPNKNAKPRRIVEAEDERKTKEKAEHHRLLYVGMTRAERWLVVCGAYKTQEPQAGMWHETVWAALEGEGERAEMPTGEGLRWRLPLAGPFEESVALSEPAAPIIEPDWLRRSAVLPVPTAVLTPSTATPHARHSNTDTGRSLSAAAHGAMVHALLEHDHLSDAAMQQRVRARHGALNPAAVDAIVAEVRRVLMAPELKAKMVLREVDLVGALIVNGEPRLVRARIDRLQMDGERILLVDFKTDRSPPDTSAGVDPAYLEQLALYRALVRTADPCASVGCAILWTANGRFMRLDDVVPERPAADPTSTAALLDGA